MLIWIKPAILNAQTHSPTGAWFKPKPGGSTPLAKMADSGSFQGYDIMLEKEKVFVHLVHSGTREAAAKVGTTRK